MPSRHIRKEDVEKVRMMIQRHKTLKKLIQQLSDLNWEILTSIKSMDIRPGTSYHTNPRAIVTKAEGYINEVVEFRGATHDGLRITENQIKGRAIDLVIPPGASCEQQAALQQVIDYGRSVGVVVAMCTESVRRDSGAGSATSSALRPFPLDAGRVTTWEASHAIGPLEGG